MYVETYKIKGGNLDWLAVCCIIFLAVLAYQQGIVYSSPCCFARFLLWCWLEEVGDYCFGCPTSVWRSSIPLNAVINTSRRCCWYLSLRGRGWDAAIFGRQALQGGRRHHEGIVASVISCSWEDFLGTRSNCKHVSVLAGAVMLVNNVVRREPRTRYHVSWYIFNWQQYSCTIPPTRIFL